MNNPQRILERLIRALQAKHPGRSRAAILADMDQAGAKIRGLAEHGYTLAELQCFLKVAQGESSSSVG